MNKDDLDQECDISVIELELSPDFTFNTIQSNLFNQKSLFDIVSIYHLPRLANLQAKLRLNYNSEHVENLLLIDKHNNCHQSILFLSWLIYNRLINAKLKIFNHHHYQCNHNTTSVKISSANFPQPSIPAFRLPNENSINNNKVNDDNNDINDDSDNDLNTNTNTSLTTISNSFNLNTIMNDNTSTKFSTSTTTTPNTYTEHNTFSRSRTSIRALCC